MDEQLKQRLVGGSVLVLLAVVFLPMFLSGPRDVVSDAAPADVPRAAPQTAKAGDGFSSRVVPIGGAVAPAKPAAPARAVPLALDQSLAAPTKEPPTPASPAPAGGDFAVQLGSFSNRQNAIALRDRLARKGYPAYVEDGTAGSGSVTRVYVGPLPTRVAARDARSRLEKETRLEGMVVRVAGG